MNDKLEKDVEKKKTFVAGSISAFAWTEKNHENLSKDSRPRSRDLNLKHPEYEAEVLATRPRRSIWSKYYPKYFTVKHPHCVSSSLRMRKYPHLAYTLISLQ
jgi:hypothetical protein